MMKSPAFSVFHDADLQAASPRRARDWNAGKENSVHAKVWKPESRQPAPGHVPLAPSSQANVINATISGTPKAKKAAALAPPVMAARSPLGDGAKEEATKSGVTTESVFVTTPQTRPLYHGSASLPKVPVMPVSLLDFPKNTFVDDPGSPVVQVRKRNKSEPRSYPVDACPAPKNSPAASPRTEGDEDTPRKTPNPDRVWPMTPEPDVEEPILPCGFDPFPRMPLSLEASLGRVSPNVKVALFDHLPTRSLFPPMPISLEASLGRQ